MARMTALSCGSLLPHLKQASLAIFSINQIDECGHDRTPLLIRCTMLPAYYVRQSSRDRRMVSSLAYLISLELPRETSSRDREVPPVATARAGSPLRSFASIL